MMTIDSGKTLIIILFFHISVFAQEGPLGEWPDFEPLGYITAPHPLNPSYHETYLTTHPHEESILKNWELGYDSVTFQKHIPQAKPGGPNPGPAWGHTDTPGYLYHPRTGEHLLYNTVRPGTKHLHPEWENLPGWIGAIQVSTRNHPPVRGEPFDQTYENILVEEYWCEQGWNQNGEVKGGLSEPTPVWVPHLGDSGKVRIFYRGVHGKHTALVTQLPTGFI